MESTDSPLAETEPKSSLFAAENSVDAEQVRLLNELNRYRMENERSIKLTLEKDVAVKAMATCRVDIENDIATI